MKYAHIDTNNKLLGWYDPDIHDTIPMPTIEVTDEQWQIAIDSGHTKINVDGTTEIFDFRSGDEITAEILTAMVKGIQYHLDTQAQALGYDNINSIGKFVGYPNPFRDQAESLGAWMANVWITGEGIKAEVLAGIRLLPTLDEVIAELPVYQAV